MGAAAQRDTAAIRRMAAKAASAWQGCLPCTEAVLQRGIDEGLHYGAQVAVCFNGKWCSAALGEAARGLPMRSDHVLNWCSTTKPVLAVAVALLRDRGLLSMEDPVSKFLPEFARHGKSAVTIRHCLTHTAGLWEASFNPRQPGSLAEAVEAVSAAALADQGRWPLDGSRCAYDSPAFQVLGRVVEECDTQRRPFGTFVAEEIFEPLGMPSCRVGMDPADYDALQLAGRFAPLYSMHRSAAGKWTQVPESRAAVCVCDPSGNGRGPAEELVRLFDALAHDGRPSVPQSESSAGETLGAPRLLAEGTVAELFSTRWREGVRDELQGVDVPWSLGFAVGSVLSGRHASPNAFGHGGSQSSFAFADPDNGVAAACLCNGKPGSAEHYTRVAAIADAIYEDLGLAQDALRSRRFEVPGVSGSI